MSKINSKLKKIIIIITALGIALIGFLIFQANQPRPLGDKLEYIGKTTSGRWLPMSSMEPTDTYYYGTDMNAEELARYFSKATLVGEIKDTSSYSTFNLQTPDSKKVEVKLYKDRSSNEGGYIPSQFAKTSKSHLIVVYDFDYMALKNSL